MIATAKTKVARAVNNEATAMADAIKSTRWIFLCIGIFIRLCFHFWLCLRSVVSYSFIVTSFGVMFLSGFHLERHIVMPDLHPRIHHCLLRLCRFWKRFFLDILEVKQALACRRYSRIQWNLIIWSSLTAFYCGTLKYGWHPSGLKIYAIMLIIEKNIHLTENGDVSLFVTEVMLSFDRPCLTIHPRLWICLKCSI